VCNGFSHYNVAIMRRVFAIFVLVELLFALGLLHSQIKDFLWTHPWWHSFLVLIPTIAVPILAILELRHSAEANELRTQANTQRNEANRLRGEANDMREEQTKHIARISELQAELNTLQAERNQSLGKIAENTQKVLTEAENNANILQKYIGQHARVTEGPNSWGGMGAIIAEVSANNILTLFVPSGFSSSQAFAQCVRCDRLHIVEMQVGSTQLEINIVERLGSPINYGEAKSWEARNSVPTTSVPRGNNVFSASYRKDGLGKKRGVFVYASTDASPNYSLVTFEDMKETGASYCGKVDVEKKFAILQNEWLNDGWRWDGGGGSGGLFLFTKP
jgi:uncharacterized membrane-anchored protein YhcB (DUF1043 family)